MILEPIASVTVQRADLPVRAVLQLHRGAVSAATAPHVFVQVRDRAGVCGWGEARPSHRWSEETAETVAGTIERYLGPALVGRQPDDLAGAHAAMDDVIAPGRTRGQPIAKSALDLALHDLLARRLGVGLPALLGRAVPATLPLCWVVSALTPEEAASQAEAGWQAGYRGFKVKVGLRPELDLAVVEAVREVDRSAFLWVDANQAYDVAMALRRARALARLDVDVLEQPTLASNVLALRQLRAAGQLPIAADESVFSAADLLHLLHLEAVDAVVVKVSKLGGLWPARRCLDLAEEAGLAILGSGLTESGLGTAASAALFGGYQLAGPIDLNGPQFLAPGSGVSAWQVERGTLAVPPGPGIGVIPPPSADSRTIGRP